MTRIERRLLHAADDVARLVELRLEQLEHAGLVDRRLRERIDRYRAASRAYAYESRETR